MKILSAFFTLLLFSCAFDGPSRPDVPISGNIVLYSGPGEAGKYYLFKHEINKGSDDEYHYYEPLGGENDSLRKIIVKGDVVFVEAIAVGNKPKYYRFTPANDSLIEEKVINKKKFDEATQDCPRCKIVPIPPNAKP